jgi:hypothetical protein
MMFGTKKGLGVQHARQRYVANILNLSGDLLTRIQAWT